MALNRLEVPVVGAAVLPKPPKPPPVVPVEPKRDDDCGCDVAPNALVPVVVEPKALPVVAPNPPLVLVPPKLKPFGAGFAPDPPNENDDPPAGAPAVVLPNRDVLVAGCCCEPNPENELVAGAVAGVLPNPPKPLDVAGFPNADVLPNPPVAGALVAPKPPNPLDCCGVDVAPKELPKPPVDPNPDAGATVVAPKPLVAGAPNALV